MTQHHISHGTTLPEFCCKRFHCRLILPKNPTKRHDLHPATTESQATSHPCKATSTCKTPHNLNHLTPTATPYSPTSHILLSFSHPLWGSPSLRREWHRVIVHAALLPAASTPPTDGKHAHCIHTHPHHVGHPPCDDTRRAYRPATSSLHSTIKVQTPSPSCKRPHVTT
jgi:hypothetical protein